MPPENINDFYGIKLKDYNKDEKCLNGTYLNTYTGSDELFQIYANNIKASSSSLNSLSISGLKIEFTKGVL